MDVVGHLVRFGRVGGYRETPQHENRAVAIGPLPCWPGHHTAAAEERFHNSPRTLLSLRRADYRAAAFEERVHLWPGEATATIIILETKPLFS